MAIIKKDMFFGEGISANGEADPQKAFNAHRGHLRQQRLNDLLGKENKANNYEISSKFQEIAVAIKAADDQAVADNREFIRAHNISVMVLPE